jgi:hypothetical protein
MSEPSTSQSRTEDVKVRLRHKDWEVEITCNEAKLKSVVEDVLSGMDSSFYSLASTSTSKPELEAQLEELRSKIISIEDLLSRIGTGGIERRTSQKIGMTCRNLLDLLLKDNFFSEERQLGQIHEEISRRGYNYDRTAVSHSLTDLVRERVLSRVGTIRNYKYVERSNTVLESTLS